MKWFFAPEPETPKVYRNHDDFAGMIHMPDGFRALVEAAINEAIRHCRIGKITMKPKA